MKKTAMNTMEIKNLSKRFCRDIACDHKYSQVAYTQFESALAQI